MIELVAVPLKCRQAEVGPDGRCIRCGRRAKFDPAFGHEVHVRGRVAGVSPYRTPAPPRRPLCPDCGAQLQESARGLRCPWTSATRSRREGGVTACAWPYTPRAAV